MVPLPRPFEPQSRVLDWVCEVADSCPVPQDWSCLNISEICYQPCYCERVCKILVHFLQLLPLPDQLFSLTLDRLDHLWPSLSVGQAFIQLTYSTLAPVPCVPDVGRPFPGSAGLLYQLLLHFFIVNHYSCLCRFISRRKFLIFCRPPRISHIDIRGAAVDLPHHLCPRSLSAHALGRLDFTKRPRQLHAPVSLLSPGNRLYS